MAQGLNEHDTQGAGDNVRIKVTKGGSVELNNFVALAERLVNVPKKEIDEQREQGKKA